MKMILVVDDEPGIVDLLKTVLEDEGYRARTAQNGQDGLRSLAEVLPDLVLLDVALGFDGQALCRAMHETPAYRAIPIALMSAARPPPRQDCDYTAFLPKPFDLDALVTAVASLIGPPGGGMSARDAGEAVPGEEPHGTP